MWVSCVFTSLISFVTQFDVFVYISTLSGPNIPNEVIQCDDLGVQRLARLNRNTGMSGVSSSLLLFPLSRTFTHIVHTISTTSITSVLSVSCIVITYWGIRLRWQACSHPYERTYVISSANTDDGRRLLQFFYLFIQHSLYKLVTTGHSTFHQANRFAVRNHSEHNFRYFSI